MIVDLALGLPVKMGSNASAATERLQMAAVALDLFRQKPWVGWGPDASHLLQAFSPFPEVRSYPQFHNGYLQMLVSFGFIGAMLMLALLIWLVRSALRSRSRSASGERLPSSLCAAALSLCASLSVSNITESIIFVKPVAMTCMLLAAVGCIRSVPIDTSKPHVPAY
jgi:O-antigen ligase